jgi:D-alanyl-D-alanine carboxypeptidase (penicillin-binding protein 5/6)
MLIIWSLVCWGLLISLPAAARDDTISQEAVYPQQTREGLILIDQDSGKVLYERNADVRLYPASTTKILTALVALENLDPSKVVTAGEEISLVLPDGSTAGLHQGQKISVQELIYGLMLPSGNDAAYTLAVNIGRQVKGNENLKVDEALAVCLDLMNERAAAIGANNSHFVNPHGYHHMDHYSTARDMARIARQAMQNPFFRQVVGTRMYQAPAMQEASSDKAYIWENTNRILDPADPYYYPGATGIKTGRTTDAGYCLVSSASRQNVSLIAVVLNSNEEDVWKNTARLLDYGFANFNPVTNNEAEPSEEKDYGQPLQYILGILAVLLLGKFFMDYRQRL